MVKKNGEKLEEALECEIGLVQDVPKNHRGPLWVKGGIQIEGADGTLYEIRNRVTLCRCGESNNMPFCDASHLMCAHMEGRDE
ncbi:MAG: CDGSH iron-sulfur domain-containing protein [Christensenellaceae bacterium]